MKVIDATEAILGRLAAKTAKDLLNGEDVVIINAEKAIITGRKETTYARYKQLVDRADRANPTHGPHFPRRPDMLLKRTVRGMINYKSKRGKAALRKLRVYIGMPQEYDGKAQPTEARARGTTSRHVTIEELSTWLGWKNPLKE